MKNRIVWLTAVLLIGFMGVSPSHAQQVVNLLPNGGFESGLIGPFGTYGAGTNEVVTDCVGAAVPEGPIEGDYCLHIVIPAAGTNDWDSGMSDGSYTFEVGMKYTFSAFVKSKSGTLQIRLKPERAADPWEGYGAQVFTMTEEWQEISVTTPVFTEEVTPASPTFHFAFAAGDFWIDGVRFYEGDYVPPVLKNPLASSPNPADGAIDVSIDTNLTWTRGYGAKWDKVYFGTDPCDMYLPLVDTIQAIFPAEYDPGDPNLLPSTTYYWYITEVNSPNEYPGPVWQFTTVRGEAQVDYPFDGAVITGDILPYNGEDYIWTKLTFSPGPTATKHTGYFNVDYSKVESRAEDANLGEPPYPTVPGWEYAFFAGNPQVSPGTQSLVRGTRYYWAVDAEDAVGNLFSSDVWEFVIQGFYAFEPSPPNEALFISTTPFLSWLPGFGVEDHEIYMGTSWEDVNNAVYDYTNTPPEFVTTRSDPNYQVVTALPHSTKIYWRVDEVQGRLPPFFIPTAFYKGDVWEFTTLPEGVGQIREDLWWGFAGVDVSLLYAHPNFPGQPDETRMLNSFNSGTDLGDNYGGMIHGWLYPAYSGDYTFWLCADDGSELFLSTDDTPANMQLIAQESTWTDPLTWNSDENMSVLIHLEADRKYYIRACWKEEGGGDHCQVAWQGPDQPLAPINGSSAAIIPGNRLEPFVQLWAHDPDPRNMQYAVPTMYSLRWGPGDHVAQHDVYLGTDKAAVESATVTTPGIYKGRIGPNSLGPLAFDAATFYHWRVDEVNLAGPDPCVWKGSTWTFRTEGAAGGLMGLFYHWEDGISRVSGDPGPANAFQIFVLSRIDPEVNFNWGDLSPDPNVNVDFFGCRWIGHVECPVDANYTFYTETDDGARLFVDGVQVIPTGAWIEQGMTWWSGEIVLSAGLHDIDMHIYESAGGAGARLAWSAVPTNPSDEGISRQIIPPIWLWPPLFASGPRPPDGATIDDRTPALEWIAGVNADYHELYFSASFDDVNNRNPAIKQILGDPCRPYPAGPRLELGKTYYWLVDEVKSSPAGRWNARTVWSFTISECLSLDNMELYNDRNDIRVVWRDGSADVVWGGSYPYLTLVQGGSSGSNLNVSTAVGAPTQPATGPIPPTPLNYQAMVLLYDNDGL
ncbi:MAG: PA14 domain-containing protein, partial [Planctomycetota bacterium]